MGKNKIVTTGNWYKKLVVLLIVLMPAHSLLFDVLISGKIDNLWRDLILVFLVLIIMAKKKSTIQFGLLGKWMLMFWMICVVFALLSDRMVFSFNLSRTYIVPTLIYFIVINMNYERNDIFVIKTAFIYSALLYAIFGIFQAFVLGDDFFINLGYASTNGHLTNPSFYINGFLGVQRVTSTLVSPNTCGAYLSIAIIVLFSIRDEVKRFIPYLFILVVGLITTFSRSAMLGLAVAMLVYGKFFSSQKVIKTILFLGPVMLFGALMIDRIALNGLITEMMTHLVLSTLSGSNASAAKHLEDLIAPINVIISNPFGLGFGHNGPMALSRYSVETVNLVESSVWVLMFDFGIFGGLLFLLPYFIRIFKIDLSLRFSYASAACLMIFITYILLPNIQSYEILFFIYLVMGLQEKEIKIEKNHQYRRVKTDRI